MMRNALLQIPGLQYISELISILLLDSKYPSRYLDRALRQIFRDDKIGQLSDATKHSTLVGLTASTTRETTTCLFTNYNGVGARTKERGKSSKIVLVLNTNKTRL